VTVLKTASLTLDMSQIRFNEFQASTSKASRALAGSRSCDTKCERLLRSVLWRRGFRFRKHVTDLPGKPDIVFTRQRIVVFCDGDFWHGKDWQNLSRKLRAGSNSKYWVNKIETNILRDERQNRHLTTLGWRVFRIWESDILTNPDQAASRLASFIETFSNDLSDSR